MKQITISVPDHQYDFFVQLVNELDFAQIDNPNGSENALTDGQKAVWKNLDAEMEEFEQEEEGDEKARPIEALLNGLD